MALKYKLIASDNRGKEETTRLIFTVAGIPFEDVKLDEEEWSDMMPDTPWKTLPILEIDGTKSLGRSTAIARYVAKEMGLAGRGQYEQAVAESIVEALDDMTGNLHRVKQCQNYKQKEVMSKRFLKEIVPATLDSLQDILMDNNYFINDQVSWADLHFYAVVDELQTSGYDEVLNFYENLSDLFERVSKLSRVKSYLKKR